jgi:FlaA1/EpsC-like NDP-sugar epimerase
VKRFRSSVTSRAAHHAIGLVVDVVEEAGLSVHGIPLLGGYDRLETIVASRAPDAVLVAASALATPGVRDALGRVRQGGRAVHVMPEARVLGAR